MAFHNLLQRKSEASCTDEDEDVSVVHHGSRLTLDARELENFIISLTIF